MPNVNNKNPVSTILTITVKTAARSASTNAGVTLEIWLKGNAGAKPLTTAKVTVAVAVNKG